MPSPTKNSSVDKNGASKSPQGLSLRSGINTGRGSKYTPSYLGAGKGGVQRTPVLNPPSKHPDADALRRQKEAAKVNQALGGLGASGSIDDLLSATAGGSEFIDIPIIPHKPNFTAGSQNTSSQSRDQSELLEEIEMLKAKIQEMTVKSRPGVTRPENEHRPRPPSPQRERNARVEYPEGSGSESNEDNEEGEDDPRRRRERGVEQPRNFRCEMDRWPIRFDGTGVQKFIKRLNRLQRSYGYSDETVAKYFHLLVEGKAANWFWIYCDEYEDVDLNHMKVEMGRVFKSEDTDMSLMTRMYERKQGNESFETFYYDILDINYSMKKPLTDPQVIEILRTNMNDEVRQRIFTYETKDRTKYFHKANGAYKDVLRAKEKKKEVFGNSRVRRINEIDFEDLSTLEIEEISSKLNNWRSKRAPLTCFNCHSPDHLLRDCPEEISRFFCFKCGLDGYATPKCPKCSLNSPRSAENSRTPRAP